jgi:hypothetical protein
MGWPPVWRAEDLAGQHKLPFWTLRREIAEAGLRIPGASWPRSAGQGEVGSFGPPQLP